MKKLNQPSKEFDLNPPSDREITSIIQKMKSSGFPHAHKIKYASSPQNLARSLEQ